MVRLLEAQENPVPVLTPQPLSRVQRFKEYAADKRQIFKKYANYKWNSFVYDPDSFMDAAKETVIKLLENSRQTKVKLILKCIT